MLTPATIDDSRVDSRVRDRVTSRVAGNTRPRVSASRHPVGRRSRPGRMARRCRSRVPASMTWVPVRVGCSVFLNNRYYDPTVGVFLSVDPLVGKTGTPYLYANGNPTTSSDPGGLCAAIDEGDRRGSCAAHSIAVPAGSAGPGSPSDAGAGGSVARPLVPDSNSGFGAEFFQKNLEFFSEINAPYFGGDFSNPQTGNGWYDDYRAAADRCGATGSGGSCGIMDWVLVLSFEAWSRSAEGNRQAFARGDPNLGAHLAAAAAGPFLGVMLSRSPVTHHSGPPNRTSGRRARARFTIMS